MVLNQDDLLEVVTDIIKNGNIVLCPSLGEYPVYNDLSYGVMCCDFDKTNAYRQAIQKNAKDKTIVEIGTGSQALLALMCAEAGAKMIYAIEANEDAAEQAAKLIKSKNLEHKIKVIYGYSTDIQLPERVDLCVSEIIGNIGSSEGAISILNSAKDFLKDDGYMIPERCITQIAPVTMPSNLYKSDLTDGILQNYVNHIYQAVGYEFLITRYAVYNFPESNVIAPPEIFEDIYFNNHPEPEESRTVEFHIQNDSRFDGFLLWVCLHVDKDNVIDTFRNISWTPVYLKTQERDFMKGDILKVDCMRKLSRNQINPDYFFDCTVERNGLKIENFRIESYHSKA